MQTEQELVKNKFREAPDDIKDIIGSDEEIDTLDSIEATYKLSQDQRNTMGREVTSAIVGATKISKLSSNFVSKLKISEDVAKKIIDEIDQKIFSKIRESLKKTQLDTVVVGFKTEEEHPNKETILNEIENPVPTKPIFSNPAGVNVVLDAQHNLPGQEKVVLISSAAVPSKGPMLGNFKNNFNIPPTIPKEVAKEAAQVTPNQIAPVSAPAPTPTETPKNYSIDPYREPLI